MGLRFCKLSYRSLRDLFLLLILIAVLSTMMTFQMSKYLPWLRPQPELKIHLDGHLNIYRSLQLSDGQEEIFRKKGRSSHVWGRKKITEEHHALITRLFQLEEQSLPQKKAQIIVLAQGSRSAIKHEVPLIESAFRHLGAQVKFKVNDAMSNRSKQKRAIRTDHIESSAWTVLMCLNNSSPDTCSIGTPGHPTTGEYQKVNIIPEMQQLLFNPQVFCHHGNAVDHPGRWQGGQLSCYLLPEESSDLHPSKTSSGCGNQTLWVLHSGEGGALPSLRKCHQLREEAETLFQGQGVAVTVPPHLFHIGNHPLIVQFHVLVMSFSPLRLYLHTEGLAWEGFSSYLYKKPQRSLTLLELQQIILDTKGLEMSSTTLAELEEAIVNVLFVLESAQRETTVRCVNCFQLLEVAIIFNTTFHPFILQVKPYTHKGKLASLNEYLVRQRILEDLAAMLVSKATVVMDVARGLRELGLTAPVDEQLCNSDQSFCLQEEELLYSLDNRREQLKKGNFIKLYPSTAAVKYTSLLQAIKQKGEDLNDMTGDKDSQEPSSTAELHSYLLSLESFYTNLDEEDTVVSYDDMNIPIDFESTSSIKTSSLLESKYQNISLTFDTKTKLSCDEDPASMPYLMFIHTQPNVQLNPEFSPLTTEYHATVDYEILLINVWAFAKSCSSQARLEDKHGNNRAANITLGIGENRISIFVVDMSHADPWVLNTYTIMLLRQGPDYQQTVFIPGIPHQICSLKQDCSLHFSQKDVCGLQPVVTQVSWTSFLDQVSTLPQCQEGDAKGQWYVPCTKCSSSPSCYWQQAVWQPDKCRFHWLPRGKVRQCFAGKKVLFIGDSTNRGILHYITEQVNGTLLEWDKTHNLKVYARLNNNHSAFSFAYYPQFWLPTKHRPVLDKALYQLIKRNVPLQNNSNTVLVVGGVHWLAKHHIDVVMKALNREGLTGIKLVIKGLGAGFHQPVSGVHCLSPKDHQRLLSHNLATLNYAKLNGFHVIDTFNMTMARYRDFLQGKCACHFHRVTMTKTKPAYKLQNSDRLTNLHSTQSSQGVYHVEGEINAAYSEMMIGQICRGS